MIRTIARRDIIGNGLKRVIKGNAVRCFGAEGIRYRYSKRESVRLYDTTWRQMRQTLSLVRNYSDANFPEHFKVMLPALSPTMEMGTIVSWEKKEGDKLNEGDLLAEIETDKATMGFETPEEGYLAKIIVAAGTKDVPIGKLVCIIVDSQDKIAAFKDYKPDAEQTKPVTPAAPPAAQTPPSPSPPPAPQAPPTPPPATPAPAPAAPGTKPGRVYASPMAKRLAEQQNIRLQGSGSGMYGSITSKDLAGGAVATAQQTAPAQRAASPSRQPQSAAPSAPGRPSTFIDIPVSNVRAVIAKRLVQSKTTIPHYYVTVDVDMTKIVEVRAKMNKELERDKIRLSVNDFVLKATAMACRKVPAVNSSWMGDHIRQYDNCDVSVAVATDNGLITPIIFQADNKGLIAISREMRSLAAKAREGKLQPHEFQGGSITVSNLGMFGTKVFSAIINPPQTCILAVGTTQQRLVEDKNEEKGFRTKDFMEVTLSCDHRVVDGALGAQWLQAFKQNLQDPYTMLL